MQDIVYYSNLFDYYGELLTNTQQDYFKDYYFNNLSQEEIASNYKVSRNAISKTLLEVTKKLDYYENVLKLNHNKEKISNILDEKTLSKIIDYI